MSLEKSLKKRQEFEFANNLTPLELQAWLEAHQDETHLNVKLWKAFILPLQSEIARLRHSPEQAIPIEKPTSHPTDFPL